jgi:hypothetical protein
MDTPTDSVQTQPPAAPFVPPVPARKNTSWGTIIALLLILGFIVVGAFYAWGKRISQEPGYTATPSTHV